MHSSQKRTFVFFVRIPLLLLTLVLLGMGAFSKRGFLDWKRMRNQNTEVKEKITLVISQREQMEKQIRSFESNKSEQERVVRQVLGYIKTNETMIEFE